MGTNLKDFFGGFSYTLKSIFLGMLTLFLSGFFAGWVGREGAKDGGLVERFVGVSSVRFLSGRDDFRGDFFFLERWERLFDIRLELC